MEFCCVICETPEQFHAECEKWAGKGVVRGRKLIAYGSEVAVLAASHRGGFREGAGRPKTQGRRHTWVVPEDVEKVVSERGISFVWESVRFKIEHDAMQAVEE